MSTLAIVIVLAVLGGMAWKLHRWSSGGERTLHDVEIEAVDGETLEVEGVDERIRLARIEAPGQGQPEGERATQAVRQALEAAEHVSIESSEHDRAGRHVAEVEVDGENLSDLLLAKGVVRPSVRNGFVFPPETAKSFSDAPEKRYTFSIQYLPMPAAFRHAAIGLREEIRRRKRNNRSFEEPLRELHRLACVQNVMLSGNLPGRWDEPMPPSVWESLEFPYDKIGFEELDLLGKRDKERMRKAWGDPQVHRSVRSGAPEIVEHLMGRYRLSRS